MKETYFRLWRIGSAHVALRKERLAYSRSAYDLKPAVIGRCRRINIIRLFSVILLVSLFVLPLVLHLPAMAQNGPPKDFHFEVLSIRPTDGSPYDLGARLGHTDPDPNGFRSVLSVYQMLKLAYGSGNLHSGPSQEMRNLPNWQGQFYAVTAKVSQADLPAWQRQGPEHELLRAAIRAALKERFRLAIHEQPSKGEVFELVVAKSGARLNRTAPANDPRPPGAEEKRPDGGGVIQSTENGIQKKTLYNKSPGGAFAVATVENGRTVRTLYKYLPGGGVLRVKEGGSAQEISENGGQVCTFYNASMNDLADFLDRVSGGRIPVRDKTGLTGRYDFTITSRPIDPNQNAAYGYPLKHLGLEIKPGTEQRPALVIDHIERPSPN